MAVTRIGAANPLANTPTALPVVTTTGVASIIASNTEFAAASTTIYISNRQVPLMKRAVFILLLI